MRNWLLSLLLVLMAVVLAFTASCGPGEGAAKTYKLGFLGPLTGPGAPWYLPMVYGGEIAAEEINEAGGIVVGGETYMIQITPADDKVSPEESVTAAQKLVFDEKVQYIFGPIGSTCALAVRPVTEENHVAIFALADPDTLEVSPEYPYTFAYLERGDVFAGAGYGWLKESHPEVKRVATLTVRSTDGEAYHWRAVSAIEAQGMEVVASEFYESGTIEFSPFLTRILAEDPDVIDVSPASASHAGLIVKQAREMGYNGLCYSSYRMSGRVLGMAAGLENAEGFVTVSWPFMHVGTPEQRAFYQKFVDKYGEGVWDETAPHAYDWIYWITSIFEEVDSFDLEVVLPALEEREFEGLTGLNRWVGEEEFGIARERYRSPLYVVVFHDGEWEVVAIVEY